MEPAGMIFFVGPSDRQKNLEDTEQVKVIEIPARQVASIGVRGGYSRANFDEAKGKLLEWLGEHPDYEKTGEAYAVFWNSPFVPFFLKRSEVNIPVIRRIRTEW
jgi:hypothetical protein